MQNTFIDNDGNKYVATTLSGQRALNKIISQITKLEGQGRDFAACLDDAATALDTLPEICVPRVVRLMKPNGAGYVYLGSVLFFNSFGENIHMVGVEAPTWALAASLAFLEASRVLQDMVTR